MITLRQLLNNSDYCNRLTDILYGRETGMQGAKGDPGNDGAPGTQGAKGDPGNSGYIYIE